MDLDDAKGCALLILVLFVLGGLLNLFEWMGNHVEATIIIVLVVCVTGGLLYHIREKNKITMIRERQQSEALKGILDTQMTKFDEDAPDAHEDASAEMPSQRSGGNSLKKISSRREKS